MADKIVQTTKYDPKVVDQYSNENNTGRGGATGSGDTGPAGKGPGERSGEQTRRTVEQGRPALVTADLVDLDLPEPEDNIEVEPKRKSSRRKSKTPKRPATRVKTPAGAVIIQYTADVAELIRSGFGLVAGRLGDLWSVSDEEALSIAKPLCRILSKYEQSKFIAENLDAVALITATGTVLVPRIILHRELVKNARATEGGVNDERPLNRQIKRTDGRYQQSEHQTGDISPIKQIIPALPIET